MHIILHSFSDFRVCDECHQDSIRHWCHSCKAKRFQNEFTKWTSEDSEIDKFILHIQLNANKHQGILEWIPFDRFDDVTYVAKGGFSTVYKAKWLDGPLLSWSYKTKNWNRSKNKVVCLKSLDGSTNKNEFLQEIENQLKFRGKNAITIYGITKNPTKNEYVIVMDYAKYGSLRKLLNQKFKELTWREKSGILLTIIQGLENIHEMSLMHKDFHSGNIVNQHLTGSHITDFGLCKPVSEKNPEKVFGIIPYMAPETLNKGDYSQASDIYSFGMIMLEVFTSYPPYFNIPHDASLVMDICKGLKPEIKCEIPQLLKELMEKCWNFDPLTRPIAKELMSQLAKYYFDDKEHYYNEQMKTDELNKNFIQYDPKEVHPKAIYTSRLIPKPIKPEDDTFDSRQQNFSIPNIIIENETQEM
ncbi:hypothetical protein Glove_606g149 [Diversispora epigaea]|uniref:Protein kinase domain-containing protein n=1 Tax=Diversispora epigaea TaxID=1348612 RepID=A0A397GCX1_9GLOM|nr:hypothetical protein Glove_606g149 [Diversispora epigaea]